MRVLARAALGRGHPDRAQPVDGPIERATPATGPGAARATSASWRPIRWVGLNEVIGSWNTIANELPSRCRCARADPPSRSRAEELQTIGVHLARRLDQPGDGESGQRLAGPGLADDPDRLARRTVKLTPRTGRIGPLPPREA